MSDPKTELGELSIILKTGLTRGNKRFVAGAKVKVGPGLAQRLVHRGQAVFTDTDAKRVKAKATKIAKAAEGIAKDKHAPAPPQMAHPPKPPEQGKQPDAPTPATPDEPSS